MERLPICPGCLSKWPDIKGLVYSAGATVGTQCADEWHRGVGYDPNKLDLTDADREFLAGQHIGF